MLSPADADLARRDTGLPGLATLLDPVAFLRELRAALPDAQLERAKPTYTRYKPHTNCLVAFQLQVTGAPVHVYAKTYGSDAGAKLSKSRRRGGSRSALGPAQIVLPIPQIVVLAFPYDAKLDVLERLDDPAASERMMSKVVPRRPDLWKASVRPLRYKPERRFVGRLTSSVGSEAALRFYSGPEFVASNSASKKLKSRGPLWVARRLGAWKRKYVMAVEWVAGRPLRGALAGLEASFDPFSRTGAALAELHAQEGRALPRHSLDAEIDRLREVAETVAFLCPDLARRARRLVERLATALAERAQGVCAVHGDFYDDQVLLSDDRVVVLDLDRAGRGNPVADLGAFAAHLERDFLAGLISEGRAADATTALLDGYQRATGAVAVGVGAHTAAALLKQCSDPFRERCVDWPLRVDEILERAESVLASEAPRGANPARAEDRGPVIDAAGGTGDAWPGLVRATDPVQAHALLEPVLSRRHAAGCRTRLRGIRVVRHKPGRRCLVQYDVEVRRPGEEPETVRLLGKMRRRGLDEDTYRIVEALWQSGWDARNEAGISVPEPMGMVPELGMWLQRWVPGKTSTSLLEGPKGVALAARIAEAAHELHSAGIPPRRGRHLVADEMRILKERLDLVAAERPEWRSRLERVLTACERLAARLGSPPLAGIHRDFYSEQLIVSGHRLFLIDLDLYCEGDPALDIGNFTAHLMEQSLRTWGDPEGLADCQAALRERFLELSGTQGREALLAYETLSLVRHIQISARISERRAYTESILELCEERLDVGRPRATPSRSGDHSR